MVSTDTIALDARDRVEIIVNLTAVVKQNVKALDLFKDRPRMQELILEENKRLEGIIAKLRV